MTISNRWEHGSDYHYIAPAGSDGRPDLRAGLLLASGRDALLCLLGHGRREWGWSRLWLPSYFCQDVVRALDGWGGSVELYRHGPGEEPSTLGEIPLRAGDVVVLVNFFGLAGRAPALPPLPEGVVVVEDHTHDPWSEWARSSDADYCVASLRKTLPIPDGGLLWSPRGRPLPSEPPLTSVHDARAAERFAAMALKSLYLHGGSVDKGAFRTHYLRSEERIDEGPISAISPYGAELLHSIDADGWRAVRRRNFEFLRSRLAGVSELTLLLPQPGAVAYVAQLRLPNPAAREELRASLIRHRIYPAVLWSLEAPIHDAIPEDQVDLSRRLLGIHCDGRYDVEDMRRVAEVIKTFLE